MPLVRLAVLMVMLAPLAPGLTAGAQAGEPLVVYAQYGSRLWLEGTTNLSGFACTATSARGEFVLDASRAPRLPNGEVPMRSATVTVPVRGLSCGNARMDQDLYDAVKADSFPLITFTMRTASFSGMDADAQVVTVTGVLSFAGVERPLSLKVRVAHGPDGAARARGSVSIRMTEHGVRPPTAALGLIRTGDRVTVNFDASVIVPADRRLAGGTSVVVLLAHGREGIGSAARPAD